MKKHYCLLIIFSIFILLTGCTKQVTNYNAEFSIVNEDSEECFYLNQPYKEVKKMHKSGKNEKTNNIQKNGIHFEFKNEKVSSLAIISTTDNISYSTYKGIKLGSTKNDVVEAYGTPTYESDLYGRMNLIYLYKVIDEECVFIDADSAPKYQNDKNLYSIQFLVSNKDIVTLITIIGYDD